MNNLEIRTNYNVLLWHFVDSLSLWSPYCSTHFKEYFESNYVLADEVKAALSTYAEIRKKLNYIHETSLFTWAYEGFPANDLYTPLINSIRYIENCGGKKLRELFKTQGRYLELYLEKFKLSDIAFQKKLTTIIEKVRKLFPAEPKVTGTILAYLVMSVSKKSAEGGANGGGMYMEILDLPMEEQSHPVKELAHEYMHLAWCGRIYFAKVDNLFSTKHILFGHDTVAETLDEVIVYSTTNVYLQNDDINWQLENTKRKADKDPRFLPYHTVWRIVDAIYPLFKDYLVGKQKNINDVREELFRKFRESVKTLIEEYSRQNKSSVK